ncbi:signal peptidase I [Buchnera aphidicola]|uniref:signal peptidase I n=1 Tax=Buchnera aphidicola TaxID=9 RepID=UPI0031B88332
MKNVYSQILPIIICIIGILWIIEKIFYLKNQLMDTKNQEKIKNKKCKYSNLITSCSAYFPIILIILIIKCFFYEPFYIASESMKPNLFPGDYIAAKKYFYGIKNPFTKKIIINFHQPKRGDIIVFTNPKNKNQYIIKRIIGIPGDKIIYDTINNQLIIYSDFQNASKKQKIKINYYMLNQYKNYKNNNLTDTKNISQNKNYNNTLKNKCIIYREEINHYKYNILISYNIKNKIKNYFQQSGQPKQFWLVPKKEYFVLGDNRHNSLDSRYIGFIPESNIIGKVNYIWMNLQYQENQWPSTININRIGKIE